MKKSNYLSNINNTRLVKLLVIVGFLLKLKNTNPFMFNLIYNHVSTPGPIYDKVKDLRLDDIDVSELLKNPISILNMSSSVKNQNSIFQSLKIPTVTQEKASELHKWATSFNQH